MVSVAPVMVAPAGRPGMPNRIKDLYLIEPESMAALEEQMPLDLEG